MSGDDRLHAAVRARRAVLRARAPAVAILSGPASDEDRAYYARTPPGSLSCRDLEAVLGELGASSVAVVDIVATPRWFDGLDRFDLVVVNLHGSPGEDGTIQGLLQTQSIRFVGSGVEASVAALDKGAAKRMATAIGVPTPPYALIVDGSPLGAGMLPPDRRRVCKPLRGGSSLGLDLRDASDALPAEGDWVVEAYLDGIDVTVPVVDVDGRAHALPAVVLQHRGEVYDADAKLGGDPMLRAVTVRPADLVDILARCERLAERMHAALGVAHVGRSDFVVHRGEPYFLETNTMPGLSARSLVAECAAMAGLSYPDLIALVVGAAFEVRPNGR